MKKIFTFACLFVMVATLLLLSATPAKAEEVPPTVGVAISSTPYPTALGEAFASTPYPTIIGEPWPPYNQPEKRSCSWAWSMIDGKKHKAVGYRYFEKHTWCKTWLLKKHEIDYDWYKAHNP